VSLSSRFTPRVIPPRWILWVIIGAVLAPFIVRTQADPDLWGHVRFGLDVLRDRSLPAADPYSFTQDIAWVNHEWLSELVMAGAYRLGGPAGLAILKGALVVLVFIVVVTSYADAPLGVFGAAFLILAAGTGRVTSTLRPQLWSLVWMAVLCRLLFAGPRRWWLIALPVLFATWVNLHGGWIVGASVFAIWTTGEFWRDRSHRRLLFGVAILSGLSTLLNPYGWQLWRFLAGTVRLSRPISEWQPLWTTPVVAWIPWFVISVGVALALMARKKPQLNRLVIALLLAVASFRVERLSGFYVVAALVLFSSTAVAQWPSAPLAFKPISRRAATSLALLMVAACLASVVVTVNAAACIPIAGDWRPDGIAGRALVDGRVNGRMVTWFDWGEYAIWHLSPSVRVSLDGRRETVYGDDVLRNHAEMNAGTREGLAYLQRLDPDYVWLPATLTNVSDWLAEHGYRIDVRTARSFVAVRGTLPVVKVSEAPITACFPGP
jgi:hypothetical protein